MKADSLLMQGLELSSASIRLRIFSRVMVQVSKTCIRTGGSDIQTRVVIMVTLTYLDGAPHAQKIGKCAYWLKKSWGNRCTAKDDSANSTKVYKI